ncbi:MAG: cell division septation protein DedD [Saprospiraceae bacterium]|jgi:cell division septation protein DedD
MTNKTKTLLFVFIILGILAIVAYGYFSTKKLDEHKEESVESNIKDFVYDETKDTLDLEEEAEDLDGDEAVVEDDDFEVYEEKGLWDEDNKNQAAPSPATGKTKPDNELEELYDNKPKPAKIKTKPIPEPTAEAKAVTTITTATTTNTRPTTAGNFLVVVGSFKSKQNAVKKKKVLEKAGVKGEVIQIKGATLHTVIAGRFSTEAEAETFKEELTKEHGLKAFVKKVAD